MSTQPQQPQHTDATAHGNSTATSISNAMSNPSNASASDGVESVRKSEPGSIVDQSTIDQSKVQVPSTGANPNPNPEVPFKERVIGVAKKTRGTILNKPEVKEHGERILQGSASVYDATGRSVS
ncbi:uncharacterized protein C8R40DRAFT_1100997 [Lentinula edodes]|uniref:uncharacterized protein n=1 Tax=Lentinula edodes TaxID=5353 RepID=UPI001E8DB8E3|nr:uncharacterized protein C8R40DRAFT_1100997 [Lentinula edodes]KAH7876185.1 hypothetical protein C8R40DRAFT_1100997 [Lentinula edodes]